jgi:hypothetical protein
LLLPPQGWRNKRREEPTQERRKLAQEPEASDVSLAQFSGSIRIPPNGGASVLLNKAFLSLENDLWVSPRRCFRDAGHAQLRPNRPERR